MWAIRGRIVPLSSDPAVAPNDAAVFSGRVWVGDDGTIAAITRGSRAEPADPVSASQLLDESQNLRGQHHLACVRADHRVPAGTAGLGRTQAIVGGTTSIQGSPPKNRPRDGWLVRNITRSYPCVNAYAYALLPSRSISDSDLVRARPALLAK